MFNQEQKSTYTVVFSSWIDTVEEKKNWIIVRFYVYTICFFIVLWTKDHDGGGKKQLVGSALKRLQVDMDAVTEHKMFLVLFYLFY